MVNLTVFCSSKNNLDNDYYTESNNLIKSLDHQKFNIIYGGGSCGIMGVVRDATIKSKGKIISYNMKKFAESNIEDDETI